MFALVPSIRDLPNRIVGSWTRPLMIRILGLALICFGLAGCHTPTTKPGLKRYSYAELHMGSVFRIVMYAPDEATADRAAEAAFRRVAALDEILSDYNPKSELRQLSEKPVNVPVKVSADLFKVLQISMVISKRSNGAFDVTVGPMVQQWRSSRKTRTLPTQEQITAAAAAVGYQKLRLNERKQTVTLTVPEMKLDVGGIAKGYAADAVLEILKQKGISRAMAAASGDIALGDPPPGQKGWKIGVASIDHPQQGLTREVVLRNAGISTSGDTEQYVELDGRRYSHIVDPRTGIGLTHRIGVTVIAKNATLSDGMATAVSVLGVEPGLRLVDSWPGISALLVEITAQGPNYHVSRQFPR
jgi:FAD:protein FMN transferase